MHEEIRELIANYWWMMALGALGIALLLLGISQMVRRARIAANIERRNRNIARTRAWDWLMGRSRTLRITHNPDRDDPA
ncbi:MAG: hypothetical protein CVT77_10690 [Alphaproteobacteria bacterium HGW-Alphaproteobacteria-16]|nr:MAG: hypothetical protein CVT77_10690 [Alphaproteobacteria bacterium HGW-Alphaproteobacteria-16]